MSELDSPSSLDIDRYLAGEASPELRARIEASSEALAMVDARRDRDRSFLARFPDANALARRATERANDTPQAPLRSPWRRRIAAGAGLGLAAALALFVLLPRQPITTHDESARTELRPKGSSAVELQRVEGSRPLQSEGEVLHPGDLLRVRYTTGSPHLLVLSVEAGGRSSVLVGGPEGRSLAIKPGQDRPLEHAIRLDEYVGRELILAILSTEPLDAESILTRVEEERTGDLPLEQMIERLGLAAAEVRTWIIQKERTP